MKPCCESSTPGTGHTFENQTRIVKSYGRMIASERAFVSKAKALDVM